jgi:hypothetical protein
MGVLILIEGDPGTGKSTSIKTLNPDETVIIRPNTKDLPFAGSRKMYNEEKKNLFTVNSLLEVKKYIEAINKGKRVKNIVVDDFSHLLGQRVLKDIDIPGFKKWTQLAVEAVQALFGVEKDLREDLYIYFMVHTTDYINEDGEKKTIMQTPGKLLDNLVKIPSYFTYILHTDVKKIDGKFEYRFLTNQDGSGKEAKTPEGCFDLYIPNDLQFVRSGIEKYIN